jgi:hypothetical protein
MTIKIQYLDDRRAFKTQGENGLSNAALGRVAGAAIELALLKTIPKYKGKQQGQLYIRPDFVNKTEKYISAKFMMDHLTDEQMKIATKELKNTLPERFLTITNSTANTGGRGIIWKEPKVLVRFTQKPEPKCPHCGEKL